MKTVQVSYSYPSSPNAKRALMPKSGCYSVSAVIDNMPVFLSGYATFDEAKDAANNTGLPISKYSLQKGYDL